MLIISDPLVASNYHYPMVKHRDIPAFAQHLIKTNNDVADTGETWYSEDLAGRFRRRLPQCVTVSI